MRFIKHLELNNYRNIKHAKLADLKDLNIIIRPNNCGKTNILRAISLLSNIGFGGNSFICGTCRAAAKKSLI